MMCNVLNEHKKTRLPVRGHMIAEERPYDPKITNYNCVVSIPATIGSRKQSEEENW